MGYTIKERYAKKFGLPASQIRWLGELTTAQLEQMAAHYGQLDTEQYVYAAKRDGGLVWHREKRDLLMELYCNG